MLEHVPPAISDLLRHEERRGDLECEAAALHGVVEGPRSHKVCLEPVEPAREVAPIRATGCTLDLFARLLTFARTV